MLRRTQPLEPETLLRVARKRTGLGDFGPDSFRPGLDRLIQALLAEADLSAVGHMGMRAQILSFLENRLKVWDWVRAHPEIRNEKIERPFVILGLPRTGTTLLSQLLDLDPRNRSLTLWEGLEPCPPPDLATRAEDPRIVREVARSADLERLVPGIHAIHPMFATGPTECVTLFAHEFKSMSFEALARVPSYNVWLGECDMRSAYTFHKVVLQMLQSTVPTEVWSLKTPNHLWAIDALLDCYPDARLIMTHRDPKKVVASTASLMSAMRSGFATRVDLSAVGAECCEKFAVGLERFVQSEGTMNSGRIHHLPYAELVRDPIQAVARAYAHFAVEPSPLHVRRMEAWMSQSPQNKHGRHVYRLEDYGLRPQAVDERFRDYRERFDIADEPGR